MLRHPTIAASAVPQALKTSGLAGDGLSHPYLTAPVAFPNGVAGKGGL